MSNSIVSIPTARISDLFVRSQLLAQIQSNASALYKSEMQISTGYRFNSIGEDPSASLTVIGVQSLLQRVTQLQTNISTSQSYLSTADSALSNVSNLITSIRATAVGATGTTATDSQRAAAAEQVQATIQELVATGNQKYAGRYLFSGSENSTEPFTYSGNAIEYSGNETALSSYSDLNVLFDTNLNGNEVFGAISSQVQSSVTITPVLTYNTALSDLNQGRGVNSGSIIVSNGTSSSTIDLSGAKTIGDAAALIKAHPPAGTEINVDITATGLNISLGDGSSGTLTISDVVGSNTAKELGIAGTAGASGVIEGTALEPTLDKTTLLQDILGAYAGATVHSTGSDNDILIKADTMGAATDTGEALNGVTITLADDSGVTRGHEYVVYDKSAKTITVHIAAGSSRAIDVANAINKAHDAGDIAFTAGIDPLDNVNGGQGLVEDGTSAVTRDGSGKALDLKSGLQITNGGSTFTVSLAGCQTVEDVLNAVNANSGLLAEINSAKDGISIRSRDSGCDFMIGENGGTTAAQLGLRTFTEDTKLSDLNYGTGVKVAGSGSASGGVDFTITLSDGTALPIDVSGATTVGDVIDLINNDSNNNGKLIARLNTYGNGIELVDNSGGTGTLTVANSESSTAAADLGLIPKGQAKSASAALTYTAELTSTVPKTAIIITANDASVELSGLQVVLDDTATGVTYDKVNKTLTVGIDPGGNTDANDVINMINSSDYASTFHAALNPAGGNDGTGKVVSGTSAIMYGAKLTSMIGSTPVPNTGVIVSAANTSDNFKGVQVVLDATATGVTYDIDNKILTVGIIPGFTTANNVVSAINGSSYASMFHAALDPVGSNTGDGYVVDGTSATITASSTLDGSDVNETETEGIFTALVRLKQALLNNDTAGIGRAIDLLDTSTEQLNLTQSNLGVREQNLDAMASRLTTEKINLKSLLSDNYDTDVTQAASDLAAQEVAYEAALKATAGILKMTLMNYL
ncbi:MAG: flagellar hook-associated protein FlgL [Thermoguttaceae bacterium]|jgi:flagellar hook-associated protein 3